MPLPWTPDMWAEGLALAASPIYLPADAAIGAVELPAVTATRPLAQEVEILGQWKCGRMRSRPGVGFPGGWGP
ncbi:MAG: hypothetical protein M3510_06875 [Actinomycetota bacterium]|nr:hypothetical protein [Actinomycetota bacterium]